MDSSNNTEFHSQGFYKFKDQLAKIMDEDWDFNGEFNYQSESDEELKESKQPITNNETEQKDDDTQIGKSDEFDKMFHLNLSQVKNEHNDSKLQLTDKMSHFTASVHQNLTSKSIYGELNHNASQLSDFGKIKITDDEIKSEMDKITESKEAKEKMKQIKQAELEKKEADKSYDIYCLNKYIRNQQAKIKEQEVTISKLNNKILKQKALLFPENYCFGEEAKKTSSEREIMLKLKNTQLKTVLKETRKLLEQLKERDCKQETKTLYQSINYLLKNHI